MKRTLLSLITVFFCKLAFSQIPVNYYQNAENKTGFELKTALYHIIKNHSSKSYDYLYTIYRTSDTKANNQVWDMYSDVPNGNPPYVYYHGQKRCGNYKDEGDCYNREHLFPQSWFSKASPMKSDAHHVIPTDGKVNGLRSSYPFGEVGVASKTTLNGSKVGSSSTNGYTKIVFEPIDEYKGDIARAHFYMATRYQNLIAGWEKKTSTSDDALNGTSDQVYEDWMIQLFMNWHAQDPVSQKETDRNNAIYTHQRNRNPFIDHPEYANKIWGAFSGISNQSRSDLQVRYLRLTNSISINSNSARKVILLIYGLNGRVVLSKKVDVNNEIHLPNFKNGMYIYKITSPHEEVIGKICVFR